MKTAFNPKISKNSLNKCQALYSAMDLLICKLHPDDNPMSNGGANFWDWGFITVGDHVIPAPHKEVGYDWRNQEVELTSKESAYTNALIFYEMLARRAFSKEKYNLDPISNMLLTPAYEWFESIGVDKSMKIYMAIRKQCMMSPNACQIID